MKDIFEAISREIEEIDRKRRAVLRDLSSESVLPARWSYHDGVLRWHVLFDEEVLEPDVDVEITSTILIVRARCTREKTKVLVGFLPVPPAFDAREPEIRFESDSLEVVLYPIGGDAR